MMNPSAIDPKGNNDNRAPMSQSPQPSSHRSTDAAQPVGIRRATANDVRAIYSLYTLVAHVSPGHLTQAVDEITMPYVRNMVSQGLQRGLVLVLEHGGQVVGYLKAFTSPYRCLAHVLTNATMMVHPEWQGKGYGGMLLDTYLGEIQAYMPHILRFELLPHHSNQRAIKFYERHGFYRESVAHQRIRTPQGTLDDEETLVWVNPNFSEKALENYHAFLSHLGYEGNSESTSLFSSHEASTDHWHGIDYGEHTRFYSQSPSSESKGAGRSLDW